MTDSVIQFTYRKAGRVSSRHNSIILLHIFRERVCLREYVLYAADLLSMEGLVDPWSSLTSVWRKLF